MNADEEGWFQPNFICVYLRSSAVLFFCALNALVGTAERTRIKNAPEKAYVPGGQRTLLLFRERLDVSGKACVPSVAQMCRARQPGECVGSGWETSVSAPVRPGANLLSHKI